MGNIENDGKTCSWPKGDRRAQTIEIIKEMSRPISDDVLDKILEAPLAKSKSDSLYKFGLEVGLTLDCIPEDLNVLVIAQDINTGESTKLLVAPKATNTGEVINEMIRTVSNECYGTREENGETVANELFTIFANVIAQYCAGDKKYEDSFINVINYWKNILNAEKEKMNESK